MRAAFMLGCLGVFALLACRARAPAQTREQQLKDSFVRQIASTGIVRDVQRSGDTVSFTARYRDQPAARWRVQIDSATVDRPPGDPAKERGLVKSSWFVDGEQIRPRGSQSDLPLPFLDNGLAQECWAFWDAGLREWSWK
jgi:hypothetical protein